VYTNFIDSSSSSSVTPWWRLSEWVISSGIIDWRDEVGCKLAAGAERSHVVSQCVECYSQCPVTCSNHAPRVRLSLKPPEIIGHLRHAHLQVGDRHVGVEERIQLPRALSGDSTVRYVEPSVDQQSLQSTCNKYHTRSFLYSSQTSAETNLSAPCRHFVRPSLNGCATLTLIILN